LKGRSQILPETNLYPLLELNLLQPQLTFHMDGLLFHLSDLILHIGRLGTHQVRLSLNSFQRKAGNDDVDCRDIYDDPFGAEKPCHTETVSQSREERRDPLARINPRPHNFGQWAQNL
jgi:hypothetical protein